MTDWSLPGDRLETKFGPKKPLYNEHEAITEANRCIYCVDAPCVSACPTDIDIPNFIHKISTANIRGAARTILADNLLGASCGKVCPVEVLCAGACVYNHWGRQPIEIGRLQDFATAAALGLDAALIAKNKKSKTGKRVACIGAGPASLAAAGHLALDGHSVVLFEQKKVPGGLNALGIAPYKMKGDGALAEAKFIVGLGDIELRTGVGVVDGEAGEGQVSAASLLADYDAVFVGIGLGPDNGLGIDGEEGQGVHGAVALIERVKSDASLSFDGVSRAVVVGAGNTAIDIARQLAMLGVADVAMVYRKDEAAMSGYGHEMPGARQSGVRLLEHRQPKAVERDAEGKLTGLVVSRTDGGDDETLGCDLVAVAIGQSRLTKLAAAFDGVELDPKGRVAVDEATCRTGNAKVYAGGDCVNGGAEVVNAAQHGKLAARAITQSFA